MTTKIIKEYNFFRQEYLCYSMEFFSPQTNITNDTNETNKDRINKLKKLEASDKIIMPMSSLNLISKYDVTSPYTFKLSNSKTCKDIYGGVLEFTSNDNRIIYLPNWMMVNLGINNRERINVKLVELNKGTFIKLRPHNEKFFQLSDPRSVLEYYLKSF